MEFALPVAFPFPRFCLEIADGDRSLFSGSVFFGNANAVAEKTAHPRTAVRTVSRDVPHAGPPSSITLKPIRSPRSCIGFR